MRTALAISLLLAAASGRAAQLCNSWAPGDALEYYVKCVKISPLSDYPFLFRCPDEAVTFKVRGSDRDICGDPITTNDTVTYEWKARDALTFEDLTPSQPDDQPSYTMAFSHPSVFSVWCTVEDLPNSPSQDDRGPGGADGAYWDIVVLAPGEIVNPPTSVCIGEEASFMGTTVPYGWDDNSERPLRWYVDGEDTGRRGGWLNWIFDTPGQHEVKFKICNAESDPVTVNVRDHGNVTSFVVNATGSYDDRVLFDSSDPGVTNIVSCTATATTTDCPLLKVRWSATVPPGSEALWSADGANWTSEPPLATSVYLKYIGLPDHNSGFGEQTIKATLLDRDVSATNTIRLFFTRDAENHPLEHTPPHVSTPNWYYYWKQTSAGFGENEFLNTNRSYTTWYPMSGWISFVGLDGTCQFDENPYNSAEGINAFAWISRHEAVHFDNHVKWWGRFINRTPAQDPDADVIPSDKGNGYSEREIGSPWHPVNLYGTEGYHPNHKVSVPDDVDYGDGFDDNEDLTNHTVINVAGYHWCNGSANLEDWAYPGKQWNMEE